MHGLIPQEFIDELLNRTDIVELIDGFVPLKKRGTSHTACCPFHSEKNPSFNVVAKKQFYHCFGCGVSGNAISFTMSYLQQTFPEAIETLAARAGMNIPREKNVAAYTSSLNLYQLLDQVTQFYQQSLKISGQIAIEYLKMRKLSGEIAKRYQIGYSPPEWHTLKAQFPQHEAELITTGMLIKKDDGKTYDRYRQRIMFPIHNRHGKIIGFGGRAITLDQKPKYLNSPETVIFQKNRELYGLHQILQEHADISYVIVVEGYMDVIALAQHGILNAVATLGTATSTYHIQLLSKHTKQVIFCFDGDEAGKNAAWRALENTLPELNSGLGASFIFLPDGHDPDSLVREEGPEQFSLRLQHAMPLNQFFFDTLVRTIDTTTITGKSQLVHAAKPYLIKMTNGPYKQLMVDELSRLTRIEGHRVTQLVEDRVEKIPQVQTSIDRTPLRIATALLLQHPEIYQTFVLHASPDILIHPEQQILKTLLQQLAQNASLNTASLVELWRNSPMFDLINQLAAWQHHVPNDARSTEFIDIVLFLAKKNQQITITDLLEKSRHEGLNKIEQHKLQDLLKQRHQI